MASTITSKKASSRFSISKELKILQICLQLTWVKKLSTTCWESWYFLFGSSNPDTRFLLRLSTPNSVLTDLVVFLFSLYLIRLTYDSHAIPMLLFSVHTHASCTPHPTNLRAVHGYVLLLFFHSATIVRLPHVSLLFHSMAVLEACFYLMLLNTGMF